MRRSSEVLNQPDIVLAGEHIQGRITSVGRWDDPPKLSVGIALQEHARASFQVNVQNDGCASGRDAPNKDAPPVGCPVDTPRHGPFFDDHVARRSGIQREKSEPASILVGHNRKLGTVWRETPVGQAFEPCNLTALTRDRKSTRLNSSHGYISYAVFCLKKKKHIYKAITLPSISSKKRIRSCTSCFAFPLPLKVPAGQVSNSCRVSLRTSSRRSSNLRLC